NALSKIELAALALELGADVPFFLDPRPAWVTGIGETIEPLAEAPPLDLVLATPAPPLATADVFRAWDAALTPQLPSRRMAARRGAPGRLPPAALADPVDARRSELAAFLANDLEPIAASLRPAIQRVQSELERLGARAVAMSGSGPTVFGV